MASTTQTTNYGLPIYQQSDKASWTDTNEGFTALDTAVKTATTGVDSLTPVVSQAVSDIADLQTDMAVAQGDIRTITGTAIPAMQEEIELAKTATGTSYSNADSGLEANTVQGAIDELSDALDGIIVASFTGDGTTSYANAFHTFYDTLNALPVSEFYKHRYALIETTATLVTINMLTLANKNSTYVFQRLSSNASKSHVAVGDIMISPTVADTKYTLFVMTQDGLGINNSSDILVPADRMLYIIKY